MIVPDTRSLPVPDGLDGMRLDQAVSRLFGLSRTVAATLVESGDVTVDGIVRAKADKVSGTNGSSQKCSVTGSGLSND